MYICMYVQYVHCMVVRLYICSSTVYRSYVRTYMYNVHTFVSLLQCAMTACPMLEYGTSSICASRRSWWIVDAAWTPCGTFLVAISKRGSLMLFPRLSGPTLASVSGCSLDLGPGTHLPIHPLVIAQ